MPMGLCEADLLQVFGHGGIFRDRTERKMAYRFVGSIEEGEGTFLDILV